MYYIPAGGKKSLVLVTEESESMHHELHFTNVYFLFFKLCKVQKNKNIKVIFALRFDCVTSLSL